MHLRIAVLLLAAAGLAAASGANKKAASSGKAAPAGPSTPASPPATAVRIAPHTFRYTDAQGKTWLYHQTPFGWMKAEQQGGEAAAGGPSQTLPDSNTRAIEDGDHVRCECRTPFGTQRWTRKKSELTGQEKQILERAKRTLPGNAGAAQPGSQE